MQGTGTQHIEKLTEDNYEVWKMQMKSVLIYNELWGYVSGTIVRPTEANAAVTWTMKDEKALALIVLGVSKTELGHIRKSTTAKAAWDDLTKVYQSRGPVRKAVLYRQLYQLRKDPAQTMSAYVNAFQEKADLLEDAGIQIPTELLSIMLLSSLPEEYENFCVAIESRDEIPPINFIKGKLIEEEARKATNRANDDGSGSSAMYTRNSKKNTFVKKNPENQTNNKKFYGTCFKCSQQGHRAGDCRSKGKTKGKPKQGERSENCEEEDAMRVESVLACATELNEWCLDSGATSHMCRDKEAFESLSNGPTSEIRTAGKESVKSLGIGTVRLKGVTRGGQKYNVKLTNVLYAPDLRNNLLSVSAITQHGYTLKFWKDGAGIIRKDGSTALEAVKRGRVYVVTSECVQTALISETNSTAKLKSWHERYGHLNFGDLKKLKDNEMVIGLDLPSEVKSLPCLTCDRAKIHVLPFKESSTRSNKILSLVHTDIWGPTKIPSLGGARYFVTFMDDKTRFIDIALLKSRSEVFFAFKVYMLRVERETGEKIIKIRSDNAKEYISKEFTQFLKNEGISRQLSVDYTPQQNGVAERANRTIVEMARCMLLQAKLPGSLWGEAVNTAAFLRNKCPTKIAGNTTPEELWTGQKPNVKFLRRFGAHATVLKKGPGVAKFDAKGEDAVLVGYSTEAKAYRFWKRGTKTIIKSRDVRFIEDLQPEVEVNSEFVELPILAQDEGTEDLQDAERSNMESEEDRDNSSTSEERDPPGNEVSSRGRGRPKILRTGKPGRPKKQYQEANIAENTLEGDPATVGEALSRPDKNHWLRAMEEEYKSLMECGTWDLVNRPVENRVISCRWVFHIKRRQNGEIEKYKARLVARGCEQRHGVDYEEVYAPVARMETIRTLFSLCAEEKLHLHQMDVVTAYVQGELTMEIFMEQPEMFVIGKESEKVCKLYRPLYGLKQAGREWHRKLREELNEIGLVQTGVEPCVFVGKVKGTTLLIVVYVDDLLIASKSLDALNKTKQGLSEVFKMKDLGPVGEILGVNVERQSTTGAIRISQERYARKLIEKFGMSSCNPVSSPMDISLKMSKDMEPSTAEEMENMRNIPYRELIGSLIYLANATRPDLAYAASVLSRFNNNPGEQHWKAAKHVLRYLKKSTDYSISYEETGNQLHAYVDADWAGDIDSRRSCSGNVVMLAGGPISWASRKQLSVALSTMEAEYMAMSDGVKEIVYTRRLLKHMGFQKYANGPTKVYCDNQSAISLSQESKFHKRSKHIDIRYNYSREAQENKEILVDHVASNENLADILTKPLVKEKHMNCVSMLGLNK